MFAMSKVCGGLPALDHEYDHMIAVCGGCAERKMTTSPFARKSGSEVKTRHPLQGVHTDLMGPMKPKSKGGALYVLTFIDDYRRFVYVYLLISKAQVLDRFREFKALAETQTGYKVKCLRSENGGEYTSKRFNQFCALSGIVHQTSAPYSPQQNGLAERMNRTLAEMARSMMHYMEVDRQWWGEAVMTAAHIVNRIPNSARRDKTPVGVLTGEQTSLEYLRVFGSSGYVHLDKSKRTKWDTKTRRCIFLGYTENSKAYRVWDVED
ncbi:hypothetical protein PR003_g4254 [Phytophthora rubi]|uniref:Integrase catalytic domain-containing protein n=3 Tax=Phytophthora rubi TaxID=129364 RepID=A0A6A4FVI6_9STRA|nr:hypothetical protein PR003_g4254 [Phytophthora rubi]